MGLEISQPFIVAGFIDFIGDKSANAWKGIGLAIAYVAVEFISRIFSEQTGFIDFMLG